MLTFAHSRGVYFMIEQPSGSLCFLHSAVKAATTACRAERVYTCFGGFGAPSLKPTWLVSTFPKACLGCFKKSKRDFKSPAQCRLFITQRRAKPPRTSGKWKKSVWVTGGKRGMKASQKYPYAFCQVLARAVATNVRGAGHKPDF